MLFALPFTSVSNKAIRCLILIFPAMALSSQIVSAGPSTSTPSVSNAAEPSTPIDLEEIVKRGTLRIIVPSNLSGGLFLPRSDSPLDEQLALAKKFAHALGVQAEIIPILSFKDMLPALNEGRGDIIVANITVNEQRKKKMAFSQAVDHAHQVVLVRKTDEKTHITKDLAGKKLFLNSATSFWATGKDFKKRYPSIDLIKQESDQFDEQVLDSIAEGKYDATIRDSNIAEMYLKYRDDLRIAFKASKEQPLAWGLRLGSPKLKASIDQYLTQVKLASHHTQKQFGDLAKIQKRGILRVLLKNNASSYFLRRGQLMGFEYEMFQAFAKHLGLRLVVLVPPNGESALDWLEQGKADLAAGFLKPTPEWQERGIAASSPYHQALQHIVVRKNSIFKDKKLNSVADLDGRTVVIHKSSDYWSTLKELEKVGINIKLQAAPENIEVEEIIEKVAKGEYEMTLVDEHLLDIELANHVAVKSAFTLGDQKSHSLAVRGEDTSLLRELNHYVKKHKDGKRYSRLYAKYFTDNKQVRSHQRARLKSFEGKKMISKYDPLVQQYSKKYGFDWRFITAQMFQESRFDPNARSHAGAIGLMQIMPATGKQLGFSKLKTPVINIHAGTKYMNWLYARFEPELPVVDRMWFTLASYNAGLGHVMDARRLAKQQGLDQDRWFDNVEKAMLLLSKSKYAKKARFGYVRGREPVGYVRTIMKLYASYINISGLDDKVSVIHPAKDKTDNRIASTHAEVKAFNAQLDSLYSELYSELYTNSYTNIKNHPACCR